MEHILEIVWICWLLSEILLNRIFLSKKKVTKNFDKNSLILIWLTVIISITLGVFIKSNLKFPIAGSIWFRYSGLSVIVIGMIFRFIAIRTLGRLFTVDLSIHQNHVLIISGLYKYIRHPSYTGSLLSFFEFALSLNNWISLIIIFFPVLSAFIHRINIEEKLLRDQIGSEYVDYMKKTKRLIPMVY